MATLTIRNLADDVISRLKESANRNRRSMEQEVREFLRQRFASREELAARIRNRWATSPPVRAEQVDAWIDAGRRPPTRRSGARRAT